MTGTALAGIALVGATGHLGEEVKRLLTAAGYPGSAVTLLGVEDVAGLVTEYGDEARVVIETAEDELRTDRAVVFCGLPETARENASKVVGAGGVVVDCTGALAEDPEAMLLPPAPTIAGKTTAAERLGSSPLLATPDAAVLLLAALLPALGDAAADAVVDLLLPASVAGERGARDLADQAAAVLNFSSADDGVFERRMAFDVWPAAGGPGALVHRYADQLARLDVAVPALEVLRASTFHGIAASVYVPGADLDAVSAALAEQGIVAETGPGERAVDSPTRVGGHTHPHCRPPRPDPRGGLWLWAVQDNHSAVAGAAVAALATIFPTPTAG